MIQIGAYYHPGIGRGLFQDRLIPYSRVGLGGDLNWLILVPRGEYGHDLGDALWWEYGLI